MGSAFDPFISHNSVHSLEGLPPRHPRSLNPAAATGRGATSSFVLSGDAANTVAEKAQNAAAQLTPLRNPLKVTVTTSPGAPVYGAESLHGEKAVTDQGGQDDEAKLEARRTEKWSSPRLQTGNEASALGEDAFAASAAKSYGAASAASGLPGKGNNDRPEVGLEEVEDGEIVDMELEGSPGDEKPRVPAAGGDGPAPQTAQVS